jgi:hypothetical protein
MTTIQQQACPCDGSTEVIDAVAESMTLRCLTCQRATLVVRHPEFKLKIRLATFHIKRGRGPGQRRIGDLEMAMHLVDSLEHDSWPSPATVTDFGIESTGHLGALQHAVWCGITAYDLDRVMGDGPAIAIQSRSRDKVRHPHLPLRVERLGFDCSIGSLSPMAKSKTSRSDDHRQ